MSKVILSSLPALPGAQWWCWGCLKLGRDFRPALTSLSKSQWLMSLTVHPFCLGLTSLKGKIIPGLVSEMNTGVLDNGWRTDSGHYTHQNPGEDKCKQWFCLDLFTSHDFYCSKEFLSFLFNSSKQNCKYKFNLLLQQSPQPILQKLYIQSKKKKKAGEEEELKHCTLIKTQLGWGFNTWMLRSVFCFAEWELESHFAFLCN